ncbi:MAG: hypothetical protein QM706_18005 [Nitrospira sp.]
MSSSKTTPQSNYITTQSGEGKIERAIHNLQRIEAGLGGLPLRYRNTDEKKKKLRDILEIIKNLEEKIKELKGD